MKDKGPRYSFFEENDMDQLRDIIFRARPIHYVEGNKGLLLTIFGNNAIIMVHSREGYENIPGATTQLYKQAFAAMEFIASAIGEEIEYAFVSSSEQLKKWAIDPDRGAGLFNWDEINYRDDYIIAHKTIKPLPSGSKMGHGII